MKKKHVTCVEEMRKLCRILVENLDKKLPLGRHRCKKEENIKMDLKTDGV
jgi:hypothetical protein